MAILAPTATAADGPGATALAWATSVLTAIVERFGYALPCATLFFLYLLVRYPDRLVGTKAGRPGMYAVPGHPLIGNLIGIAKNGTHAQFHRFLAVYRSSPSPVYSWTFPPQGRIIMLNRPEYIEHVQKTNFDNYPKGSLFRAAFQDVLGATGIFVADGHTWKVQRKMASHIFSVNQFRNIVQVVVHDELRQLTALLANVAASPSSGKEAGGPGAGSPYNGTIELTDLCFRYTLSSFTKMALGKDVGCLSSDPAVLKNSVPFSVAFDHAQNHINNRFSRPGWQFWERFTASGRRMRGYVETMREFALDIVQERLRQERQERIEAGEGEDGSGQRIKQRPESMDLLGLFTPLTQDPEDLFIIITNFLVAGRDTTAQALSWLFVELIAHPQHVDAIRAEITAVLGGSPSPAEPHLLEYDRMRDLPFTQACISEAVRLHPPVPKNGKRVTRDDVIVPAGANPEGLPPIRVYANEQVAWSDWVMARCPEIWGADCEEFNPYRFLERDSSAAAAEAEKESGAPVWKYVQPTHWKFHAFNGGPRLCLGISLANYEALSFLVAVLPHFDLQWATPEEGQVCVGRFPPANAPKPKPTTASESTPVIPTRPNAEETPALTRKLAEELVNEYDHGTWPPRYKSSVTHPCEEYTVRVVRRT